MLLRHLRHLTSIAEHGSIARAAETLRLAQPALSREMRLLEQTLGVTLMQRERRGIRLTAAGAALVADASVIFARLGEALDAAHEADEGRRGTVRVGLGRLALDSCRVGRALAAVRERYPRIRVNVGEVQAFTGTQALRGREYDVTIGSYLADDSHGLRTEVLYEDRIDGVLLSTSHPLARSVSLSIADVRHELLLGVGWSYQRGYSKVIDALRAAGVARIEGHPTVESIFGLVAAGRGWAAATREQRSHPPPGTVIVPLRDLDVSLPIYVRWRAHDSSRACENVVQLLLEALGSGDAEHPEHPEHPEHGEQVEHPERSRTRGQSRSPELELRQLEALVATVDERSLSRAAGRLGLTQSGMSRRLRALERDVGCVLLERVAAGVAATGAGELLHGEAREVLRLVQQALGRARRIGGGDAPACRIGALPPELTGEWQQLALRRLVAVLPHARFELTEMLPETLLQALRDRRIDVGIGGGAGGWRPPASVASVLLTDDPVDCVMVAASHRWAARAWVTAADLAQEPFLFVARKASPRVYDAILRGLAEIGLTPQVGATHDGPRAVWRGVAEGLGWTIGSRSQRSNPPRGLTAVPVEGLHIPWGIALLWRRDEDDPLVRRVLEIFRETRNPDVPVVVATVRAALGPESVGAG